MKHTHVVAITNWSPAFGLIGLSVIDGVKIPEGNLDTSDSAHIYLFKTIREDKMEMTKANNRWLAKIVRGPGDGPNGNGWSLKEIKLLPEGERIPQDESTPKDKPTPKSVPLACVFWCVIPAALVAGAIFAKLWGN